MTKTKQPKPSKQDQDQEKEDSEFYYYNTDQEQRNAIKAVMQQRSYFGYERSSQDDYLGYME